MSTTHRIRRQRWTVQAPSEALALEVRRRLRDDLEAQLLPLMESVFDSFAPGDQVVHVPRLEVRIELDDVEQPLHERLSDALTVALNHATAATVSSPTATGGSSVVPRRSAAAVWRDVVRAYLRDGTVPWHAIDGETAARLRASIASLDVADLKSLLAQGGSDANDDWFRRLLQMLPETRWQDIGRIVVEQSGEVSSAGPLSQAIASATTAGAPPSRRSRIIRVAKLLHSAREGGASLAQRIAEPSSKARAAIRTSDNSRIRPPDGEVSRIATYDGAAVTALMPEPIVPRTHRDEADAVRGEVDLPPWLASSAEAEGLPVTAAIPVHDCGLVLLHPFLPAFFAAVRVTDPNRSRNIDVTEIPRAAALLRLLATGSGEALELELGLVRALLGVDASRPMLVTEDLVTPDDRLAADTLLTAVIGHWSALKSTTIATLRPSFLLRPGWLWETDHSWHLTVEPRAYDMLIDRLPWGIGTSRLPWMQKPLLTRWPTP